MELANSKLIENLENQLERLVQQLKDLEEFKNDLTEEEFLQTKEDTAEQITDFSQTLDRMVKGDLTLNSKISVMQNQFRKAVANSFNTNEIIKMFGIQSDGHNLENQLVEVEQVFRTSKNPTNDMKRKKYEILNGLKGLGRTLSKDNELFLSNYSHHENEGMEAVLDE